MLSAEGMMCYGRYTTSIDTIFWVSKSYMQLLRNRQSCPLSALVPCPSHKNPSIYLHKQKPDIVFSLVKYISLHQNPCCPMEFSRLYLAILHRSPNFYLPTRVR